MGRCKAALQCSQYRSFIAPVKCDWDAAAHSWTLTKKRKGLGEILVLFSRLGFEYFALPALELSRKWPVASPTGDLFSYSLQKTSKCGSRTQSCTPPPDLLKSLGGGGGGGSRWECHIENIS